MDRKRNGPGQSHRRGISLIEAVQRFSNEADAEAWFIETRWPDGTVCPFCNQKDRVIDRLNRKPQPWYCGRCRRYFSIKTNTIMHSSPLPLSSWAIVFYLLSTSLKGVSSMKLHRDLNVTQKTAWFMAMRIRETLIDDLQKFNRFVEADETYIGGSDRTRHKHKRSRGRGTTDKIPVAGLRERRTKKVHVKVMPDTRQRTLKNFVEQNTADDIILFTDQSAAYNTVNRRRVSVNHNVGEYVRGMAHTNGIESFWAMFDRAYMGTYHKPASEISLRGALAMAIADPIVITASEARNGTERTLTFPDTGKQIVLTIPKGIEDGQKIRIVYYGNIFLIPVTVLPDTKPPERPPIPLLGNLLTLLFIASIIGLPIFTVYHTYILQSSDVSYFNGVSKLDLFQYNLTHFPPSSGPHLGCLATHMDTPRANQLREQTFRIGRQIEGTHGYDLTSNTLVSVVPSLQGHGGLAHSSGLRNENCIQLAINNWDPVDSIRHEWAHVAARGDAHGPTWRETARKFGASTHGYNHCQAGDSNCERTTR